MAEVLLALSVICWLIGMILSANLIYKSTHKSPCETCNNLLWDNPSEVMRFTCKKHGRFYRAPKYCSNYENRKQEDFNDEQ